MNLQLCFINNSESEDEEEEDKEKKEVSNEISFDIWQWHFISFHLLQILEYNK